jgi:deoxyribose-phosphate aldolase
MANEQPRALAASRMSPAEQLRGSGVLVGTVVGFPHGNETPTMKVYQAREVLDLGADEIDPR